MDHIDDMDQLRNGINLRALGQQDPAAAYAHEGFDMFELMIQQIKEETVMFCYNVTLQTNIERKQVIAGGKDIKEDYQEGSLPGEQTKEVDTHKPQTYRREGEKIGRNDLCPCGSGKKYKNCCGKN